jgi:hypothetical protein
MKYLVNFLSSASNGKIQCIKPQNQRLLQLLTGLIWFLSITWTSYNIVQTGLDNSIYQSDKELISSIQQAIESDPQKYQNNGPTYSQGQGGTSYFNIETTLFNYFSKLSFYEPHEFNPNDVLGNYERAKSQLGANPYSEFTLRFFIFIILGNLLWWILLRCSFWLKFGSTSI